MEKNKQIVEDNILEDNILDDIGDPCKEDRDQREAVASIDINKIAYPII